jgi:methylthioribose-1-phosphate isomerase
MTAPNYRSVEFISSSSGRIVRLLDQTKLPTEVIYIDCVTVEDVWHAIRELKVRGAPAIGIAAAYGTLLSRGFDDDDVDLIRQDIAYLRTSRPTAVNLFWALDRVEAAIHLSLSPKKGRGESDVFVAALQVASAIHTEDIEMCHAIGRYGAELFDDGFGVLTHCNTGGLATSELGTALSAIIAAHRSGKRIHVYADETRPLLQGARLTMWELQQYGIPSTLICDNMAAQVMREGKIQAVIVGADRITRRGDTANKIGTYGVAILAKHHGIPFYVAAPSSTFDLTIDSGSEIPIEQRSSIEVTHGFGRATAPPDINVYNPAFDVTPAELITSIITERGIIKPVTAANIAESIEVKSTQ